MIREAIAKVVEGQALTVEEAAGAMEDIMTGQATPAQIAAFITALRMKGETVEEIAGMARVMRAHAVKVPFEGPVVDTCGTGGDRSSSFNISTTAAFVVAGVGLKVAKHGNRAVTSQSGSADVLEALGVRIELAPEQVAQCLEKVGIGFMFAPAFHPAMRYAAAPRQEIGIRTIFNILGPLTNPAGAQAQLLGVANAVLGDKMSQALRLLGCHRALVVHGDDGLDELTITGPSQVWELRGGQIRIVKVAPEDFGFGRATLEAIRGASARENAGAMRAILGGARGPIRDVVLMNAAAALVAGGATDSLQEAVGMAAKAVDSGMALRKLDDLIALTQSFQ